MRPEFAGNRIESHQLAVGDLGGLPAAGQHRDTAGLGGEHAVPAGPAGDRNHAHAQPRIEPHRSGRVEFFEHPDPRLVGSLLFEPTPEQCQ